MEVHPCYQAQTEDAGNGSLMRLAPIPIFCHSDVEVAREMAAKSSSTVPSTTHPDPIAAEACKLLAHIVRAMALALGDTGGESRQVLSPSQLLSTKPGVNGVHGVQQWLKAVTSEYYREVLQPREGAPGTAEIARLIESAEGGAGRPRRRTGTGAWHRWTQRGRCAVEDALVQRMLSLPWRAWLLRACSADGPAPAPHSAHRTRCFGSGGARAGLGALAQFQPHMQVPDKARQRAIAALRSQNN
jgi:hypothetical protein